MSIEASCSPSPPFRRSAALLIHSKKTAASFGRGRGGSQEVMKETDNPTYLPYQTHLPSRAMDNTVEPDFN